MKNMSNCQINEFMMHSVCSLKMAYNYPLPATLYRIYNKLTPKPYEPTKRNPRSI